MRQTLAILLDSYRELNARRLFWVTLALSALVVVGFALLGVTPEGELTVLGFEVPLAMGRFEAEGLFKGLFVHFGINFWLAWLAAILALVSTAGIFPDLVSSGSTALILSKPVGRARLFLTRYVGGLLFVTLQVTVFTVASFFVLGGRAGVWEPGLLLAIPLVVLFFSYLFAICVLLGVLTRSTIAALLLTLLVWFGLWAVHTTETTVLQFKVTSEQEIEHLEAHINARQATDDEEASAAARMHDVESPLAYWRAQQWADRDLDSLERELEHTQQTHATLARVHGWAVGVTTLLPKTGETIDLLRQSLYETTDFEEQEEEEIDPWQMQQAAVDEAMRERSAWWVVGSSLGFEFVVLGLGMWVFCRRDF